MGTEIFFGKPEIRLDSRANHHTAASGCSPDGAKRNPGLASRSFPDFAEFIIGRAFARPVGSIRATTFANVIASAAKQSIAARKAGLLRRLRS
jgi:hypothetical protein